MIPIEARRYPKLVLALGGNALIRPGEAGTLEEQRRRLSRAMAPTADLVTAGFAAVITHGNGPMVGHLLLQMECARATVPPMPLFMCDADSEGSLGYLIQQCLVNELRRRGKERGVVTVVTQVVVAADDPAFSAPDKPIGPFYAANEAERLQAERGWQLMEDAGRGWRRVVPSPRPLTIIEQDVISYLMRGGIIVIAAGGGGVPVVRRPDGDLMGVEAVIDKDRASAVLAREIAADSHGLFNRRGICLFGLWQARPASLADADRRRSGALSPRGSFCPRQHGSQDGGGPGFSLPGRATGADHPARKPGGGPARPHRDAYLSMMIAEAEFPSRSQV